MTKTTISATTPHATKDYDTNPSGIVIGLTVSMSWQLALVVLIPIVGGHMLDNHLHPKATPTYTLLGLLVAIVGMIIVIRRTLQELNKYMAKSVGTDVGDSHDQ